MPSSPSHLLAGIICSAMLLTACSHRSPEARAAAEARPAAAPWNGMKQDEQRAREVQKMAEQRAALEQKKIEDDSR